MLSMARTSKRIALSLTWRSARKNRAVRDNMLLFCSVTEFGKRGEPAADAAHTHFDESKCIAFVADQIEFALGAAAGSAVARDENIAKLAQIRVGVGFAANASPLFTSSVGGVDDFVFIAQTVARLPANALISKRGEDRHM